jgi:hypothetical protein
MSSVRIQVLTAASMKIIAFWNIVPCSLVVVDRRFRRAYASIITSELSVYYETTRRNISEGYHLQTVSTCRKLSQKTEAKSGLLLDGP